MDEARAIASGSLVLPSRIVRAARCSGACFRGQRVAAARDGNRIRVALERALSLDPTLEDAYFGVGLYHYYAAVAPAAAKLLRLLLFLPGGNRAQGLREMLQAREHGELLRGEADYQLHWLYLWYEQQPARALELLQSLDARYPSNPIFLRRIAQVQDEYLHDHAASAAAWQALLDRAEARHVEAGELAEMDARIGLGSELVEMDHADRAVEQLEIVIARRPSAPYSAQASAAIELGIAYDRLGQRDRAAAAYRAAIALAPSDDPLRVRDRARSRLMTENFDNSRTFVLDILTFSTIIYIWYEGGSLRPPLVRLSSDEAEHISTLPFGRATCVQKVPRREGRRRRVSVPGGSHWRRCRERPRSKPT